MTFFFLFIILMYSLIILCVLAYIDLKTRLLPNRYVLQLFFCGMAFHIISGFTQITVSDLLIASLGSSGLLLIIRAIGNKFYKTDTLGMGDIKLIGTGGVWLGSEYIFLALSLGAIAGLIHGIGVMTFMRFVRKEKTSFSNLSIPAGPGFIIGIIICAALKYHGTIIGSEPLIKYLP